MLPDFFKKYISSSSSSSSFYNYFSYNSLASAFTEKSWEGEENVIFKC